MSAGVGFRFRLTTMCIGLYALVLWSTAEYPVETEFAGSQATVEGIRLLDTCDRRPTDQLRTQDSTACLADYLGDFVRNMSPELCLLTLNVGHGEYTLKQKTKKPQGVETKGLF